MTSWTIWRIRTVQSHFFILKKNSTSKSCWTRSHRLPVQVYLPLFVDKMENEMQWSMQKNISNYVNILDRMTEKVWVNLSIVWALCSDHSSRPLVGWTKFIVDMSPHVHFVKKMRAVSPTRRVRNVQWACWHIYASEAYERDSRGEFLGRFEANLCCNPFGWYAVTCKL